MKLVDEMILGEFGLFEFNDEAASSGDVGQVIFIDHNWLLYNNKDNYTFNQITTPAEHRVSESTHQPSVSQSSFFLLLSLDQNYQIPYYKDNITTEYTRNADQPSQEEVAA